MMCLGCVCSLRSQFPRALQDDLIPRLAVHAPILPAPPPPCPLQVREVIRLQNENPNMRRLRDGNVKLGNLQDLGGQRVLASPRSPLPPPSPDSSSSPPASPPPTDSPHLLHPLSCSR